MRALIVCLIAVGTLTAQTAPKCVDCGLGSQRHRSADYKRLIELYSKSPTSTRTTMTMALRMRQ